MYRCTSLLVLVVSFVAACENSGSEGGATCQAVSTCVVDAVAALKACAPAANLMLGTPTNNSGVVDNLTCTGAGGQSVEFSTFSFSVTGTVPLPSIVTLKNAGAMCAAVHFGTGTRTNKDGSSTEYIITTIERPGADSVTVNRYSSGELGVECGQDEEVLASSEKLTDCEDDLQWPTIARNPDITNMKMEIESAANAVEGLFSCDR